MRPRLVGAPSVLKNLGGFSTPGGPLRFRVVDVSGRHRVAGISFAKTIESVYMFSLLCQYCEPAIGGLVRGSSHELNERA
jgi:hypothetical protein